MIDFNPNEGEVLMSQDIAMKFMVWAGYYNDLVLEPGMSFARFGKFTGADIYRLDNIQNVLFKCFDPASVARSMNSIRRAKACGEQCPYSEESLNGIFGKAEK